MNPLASGAPPLGLLRGYAPRPGVFDEMLDGNGRVRPAWRPLIEQLDSLGEGELGRRWEKARQQIHENGVSYNVYGDDHGLERVWNLSLIPVVFGPEDWALIGRGLAQRGRLLAALLADLYGPQRALIEGLLPPELVFANPCYLRPIHGLSLPVEDWLPIFGADLVRAADGSFQVVEDRVQVPTGAGYALENRIVCSSVLPEQFRECNVERLAPFFRQLRETLQERAPHNRDNPRIVLLTPGPYDATYFEQAYLAQYLGFTLVNGGDLTVRHDKVFLKTLGGLQPVDVVFRRLNDEYCDPLELRADSMLGVPGLVQAVRARNVAIANPLGTGLLQTAAILPYLPGLCRGLLGETLEMQSVPTWWCGDDAARAEALSQFDELVVRTTFHDGNSPVFTAALSTTERNELRAKIEARPSGWVAQRYVSPSTTPFLEDGGITPRALILRCYAVGAGNREYRVMPGALARIAVPESGAEVTMQKGARSKDVWVLSHEQVAPVSLLPSPQRALMLSRGGSDLPSRAADNLYWLGRYAERAEGIARLGRVLGARLAELGGQPDLDRSSEFGPLLAALRAQNEFLYAADIPMDGAPSLAGAEAQLLAAVHDKENTGSLSSVVRATLRAGRLVRDRISTDTWRVLAALDEELTALDEVGGPDRLSALVALLNRVVLTLAGFTGLVMESMTRGQSWRFVDMGRRLERAVTLLTLLRATMVRSSDRERPLLEAVLEIADSGMTYRRRYLAMLQAAPVVDLLLCDETNPRSVLYQARALTDHVRALPPLPGAAVRTPQLRLALSAQQELELAEIEQLCQLGADGARPALDAMLRRLGTVLPALSDSLSDSYLNHATVPRHLTRDSASGQPPRAGGGGEP